MKKLSIYLSLIVALFVILYIVNHQSNKAAMEKLIEPAQKLYQTTPDQLNPATQKQLNDPNYQNIILQVELIERLEKGEGMFVYFFSPLCQFCVESTPIVNETASDLQIEIHQFNVLENQLAFQLFQFDSTPTLIYFEDGQEQGRLVGSMKGRQDTLKEFLQTHHDS